MSTSTPPENRREQAAASSQDKPVPGSQEWIDKHMAVAHELAVKSANSVLPAQGRRELPPEHPARRQVEEGSAAAHAAMPSVKLPPPPSYPTEWVECDRCGGDGEYENDLWVTVRCYSCWGTGHIEVCAECGDNGEECDACGC